MGKVQRLIVRLHPCGTGRKDFSTHVGMAEWVDGEVRMADICQGKGTLYRVGVVNQLQCDSCGMLVTPKKGKGMNDKEFESRWAWDFLRALGPVPEGYQLGTLAPRVISIPPHFSSVIYWPNWAESGEGLFVVGHTCQSFEEIVPAIYINEASTHNIMSARLTELEEKAKSGMASLYWKLQ